MTILKDLWFTDFWVFVLFVSQGILVCTWIVSVWLWINSNPFRKPWIQCAKGYSHAVFTSQMYLVSDIVHLKPAMVVHTYRPRFRGLIGKSGAQSRLCYVSTKPDWAKYETVSDRTKILLQQRYTIKTMKKSIVGHIIGSSWLSNFILNIHHFQLCISNIINNL